MYKIIRKTYNIYERLTNLLNEIPENVVKVSI